MSKPVIVQSDNTLLLEVNNPDYEDARDAISHFAELEKSPEHIHTYRITPLSLWNAAAMGMNSRQIIESLSKHSRYEIPEIVITTVKEQMSRYGILKLIKKDSRLILTTDENLILTEIISEKKIQPYIAERIDENNVQIKPNLRGHVKQALIKLGFPVEDLAGYDEGDPLEVTITEKTMNSLPFMVRDYQQSAINAFYKGGGIEGGSGVIVLPCGAGKTIVGIGVMDILKTETLILVTNTVALRQWREELLDKTNLAGEQVGEYSGERKEIKPVTIATYNILTYRKKKNEDFVHFDIFMSKNWGLIIYDEVHLLPAPVFRMTSEIQSKRRLGLTATLERGDGSHQLILDRVGPLVFQAGVKDLGPEVLAPFKLRRLQVQLSPSERTAYEQARAAYLD
ncbi:MAG TPA: helicase-associated domain-containing protein, partial [Spirochaetota bacterium]|nr:helicase-associated domain-containing protein [Spirochaetota bacterium]